MRRALHDADTPVDGRSIEALQRCGRGQAGQLHQRSSRSGRRSPTPSDAAAYAPLERASALVPSAVGVREPAPLMAQLAEELGDPTRAMKEYEALLAVDHTNVEAARRLADARGKGRRRRD